MVKKQPDKFERMIDDMGDPPFEGIEVYAQFRQYHNEVVELVQGERLPASCCHNSDFMDGNHDAIKTILNKLKEFAK